MTRKIEALASTILRCPVCAGRLNVRSENAVCSACGRAYPFVANCLVLDPNFSVSTEPAPSPAQGLWPSWGWRFEKFIYTRHNHSPAVQGAIGRMLALLDQGGVGLNIGSGWTNLHPQMINLDVTPNETLDLVGDAHALPFNDGSLRCIVSQEVFEHLQRPWQAIQDVARVLAPGGRVYIQVPLVIGLHSIPYDYYRFTPYGLRVIVESAGLKVVEIESAVGAGTALYRILVEFCGSLAGSVWGKAYRPVKAFAALVAAPIRWFDPLTMKLVDSNRVSAGYYVIAEKAPVPDKSG